MTDRTEDDSGTAPPRERNALLLLRNLPDHCAMDIGALADRIGADKLALIQLVRTDIKYARLVESKVTK